MSTSYKGYELNSETIEEILQETEKYCSQLNTEQRQILRVRLTLDELLLTLMEHYGNGASVSIVSGKYRGRQIVRLQYEGDPFDPTKQASDEWSGQIMASLGLSPVWTYRRKINTVTITVSDRSRKGTLFYIAAAAILGIALGLSGHWLPESVWSFIDTNILSPAMGAYMGLLKTFAGIMIAFTICSGIIGFGDSAALLKAGKGIIVRFSVLMIISSVFGMLFMQPFVQLNWSGEDGGSTQISALSEMIFGIVPKNLIDPFLSGNAIQIIVIALCIGAVLLTAGERARTVRAFVTEGAEVLQRLASSICGMIPIYVFMALAQLIGSKDGTVLLSLWKPLCLAFAGQTVLMLIFLLWTSARIKCSPILLFKKSSAAVSGGIYHSFEYVRVYAQHGDLREGYRIGQRVREILLSSGLDNVHACHSSVYVRGALRFCGKLQCRSQPGMGYRRYDNDNAARNRHTSDARSLRPYVFYPFHTDRHTLRSLPACRGGKSGHGFL